MTDSIRTVRPDPRITRRRKAIERSRKKKLLLALSFAGVVVVVAWAAFWSPLLDVRRVQVTGSKHVTGADIETAAHIGSGTNLLLLSTSRVVDAAEALPWVRRARVDRSLPGTVRVRIVERRPVIVLRQGSSRWFVDRSGYVIAPATGGHHHLPTLAGVGAPSIRPGLTLTSETGAGAIEAWRSLPRKLIHRVVAVFAPTVDAITFSLKDGTTVRYGPPTDMKDKNQVLLALLHKVFVDGTGASYIDVRVPTSPAVGPPAIQNPGPTPADTASAVPAASPSPTPTPTPTTTPTK
jgi:cell division protein FtsQ